MMDTPINSNMLKVSIQSYRMHTQLFDHAIAGISDEDAKKRISGRTNHMLWMAGNLVNNRFWLANAFGIADKDPHGELFDMAKALDETFDYPSLAELKANWHRISPLVYQQLTSATDEELLAPYDMGMGDMAFIESNYLSAVGMGVDREEYLLGQLGLMRRLLDYPAMSYELDAAIAY